MHWQFSGRVTPGHLAAQAAVGTVVVGGGPAGLALLLAARRAGRLHEWLDDGLRVIEGGAAVGAGEIGRYRIRSDSLAESFTGSARLGGVPSLAEVWHSEAGRAMLVAAGDPVPLPMAGAFLDELGAAFARWFAEQGQAPFLTETWALQASRQLDGSWLTEYRTADGSVAVMRSRSLVIATGAAQTLEQVQMHRVADIGLQQLHRDKLVLSSDVLGPAFAARQAALFAAARSPRIVILGGSHSALSCARVLLQSSGAERLTEGAVTVLHRQPMRLTYATPQAALDDGFTGFGASDVCAKSGRVFPLAGFRADTREFVRRALGLGSLQPDPRLRLLCVGDGTEISCKVARAALDEADLIVAAFGYRPRALPLFDVSGAPIRVFSNTGWGRPLVDGRSRVLDERGEIVPGAFALGLSAGYPLAGRHGEPSFIGQANGLSLWQTEVGEELLRQILPGCPAETPSKALAQDLA